MAAHDRSHVKPVCSQSADRPEDGPPWSRRRDSSSRNIHVVAAASTRLVFTEHRGVAAADPAWLPLVLEPSGHWKSSLSAAAKTSNLQTDGSFGTQFALFSSVHLRAAGRSGVAPRGVGARRRRASFQEPLLKSICPCSLDYHSQERSTRLRRGSPGHLRDRRA